MNVREGVAAILVLAAIAGASRAEQVVDIPTRAGVSVRALTDIPAQPKAILVLLPGGEGVLGITESGSITKPENNFLVRTRRQFVTQGFGVALIDAPSDRSSAGLKGFRKSREHTEDLKAVAAHFKAKHNLPVWMVGTSRGTISAAIVAVRTAREPLVDGVVLTAAVVNGDGGETITSLNLEKIAVPVLLVHHESDGCRVCKPQEVGPLMTRFTDAKRSHLQWVKGGEAAANDPFKKGKDDPCGGTSHHGFLGIEESVVALIAKWIQAGG